MVELAQGGSVINGVRWSTGGLNSEEAGEMFERIEVDDEIIMEGRVQDKIIMEGRVQDKIIMEGRVQDEIIMEGRV